MFVVHAHSLKALVVGTFVLFVLRMLAIALLLLGDVVRPGLVSTVERIAMPP